jgi:hypothetical protein
MPKQKQIAKQSVNVKNTIHIGRKNNRKRQPRVKLQMRQQPSIPSIQYIPMPFPQYQPPQPQAPAIGSSQLVDMQKALSNINNRLKTSEEHILNLYNPPKQNVDTVSDNMDAIRNIPPKIDVEEKQPASNSNPPQYELEEEDEPEQTSRSYAPDVNGLPNRDYFINRTSNKVKRGKKDEMLDVLKQKAPEYSWKPRNDLSGGQLFDDVMQFVNNSKKSKN